MNRDEVFSKRLIDHPLKALGFMAVSGLCFSIASVLVKKNALQFHHHQIVFFRAAVNFVITASTMLWRREPFTTTPSNTRVLAIRGISGFLALTCFFYSITRLPISVAGMLNWCAPLFVFIISGVFLNEKVSRSIIPLVMFSFFGLYLLLNPDFATSHAPIDLGAAAIGILGALFASSAYVAVRAANRRGIGVNMIILYFTGTATLLSLPLMALHFQMPIEPIAWLELVGVGIFSSIAQIAMTHAYLHAPAGIVSTMSLLGAAFSALWGLLFFSEHLSHYQWLGMIVLAFGVGSVALKSGKK